MTRYASVSRGKREANNELKAGFLGSDRPVLFTTTALNVGIISGSLGVMSASGMQDLKSEKRFP